MTGHGAAAEVGELEQALARLPPDGEVAGAVRIAARAPLAYRSTFPVEELHVEGAGGGRRIVLKDLGAADAAVKPYFLLDPLREIEAYRDVLEPSGLSTPAYLGSVVEPARGRYWLFLERVEGEPLWQRGELAAWQAAAAWLARLHGRFAARSAELPRRLLRHDASLHARWLPRARRFLGSRVAPAAMDRLARRAAEAASWLEGQRATLLHGDFHPSNVLLAPASGTPRVCPVDWEMAGVGPGALDLAALVSGDWSAADRAEIAAAYRDALPPALRPSRAALREGVDRCRLLLAVQWLGWSASWRPPPEQDHDWLGTALALSGGAAPEPPPHELGVDGERRGAP